MKYKAGDEVVLKSGEKVKIESVEDGRFYVVGRKGDFFLSKITDSNIDHKKTAELQKKDKALKHYQGELEKAENNTLEKLVDERNNDEYTKALMKYGRREGDNLDAIKPKHYHRGLDDLIEGWYRTQPWNEWRTSMVNLAERYFRRDKNDPVEDIEKGIFVMNRVKEKEIERCET